MLKGPALALVLGASLAVGTGAQAREPGIVGVVTRVEPNTIEVLTDSGEKTSVTVNASTTYLKWIMAKPWQQDPRTDRQSLRIGRRVLIDATPGVRPVARTVWVVTGRPGLD